MGVRFIPVSSREEFMAYRSKGIGASEVGTLKGLNKHECRLSLYHLKLGIKPPKRTNLRMNIGKISEDITARLYTYHDYDLDVFNYNMDNLIVTKKLEEVNAYCINDKYPNLFVSLDRREIFKDGTFGAVELKNKTNEAYSEWKNEMNPCEALQLASQLMASEYKLGHIVYLVGNDKVEVFPMQYSVAIKSAKMIMTEINSFWSKIENARIITNQIHYEKDRFNMKAVAELTLELMKCEPEPEFTEAYLQYMTDLSIEKRNSVPLKGTDEQLMWAKGHKKTIEKIKKLEKEKAEFASKLAHAMGDKKEIDFGKDGKVSLFGRFSNKVKI